MDNPLDDAFKIKPKAARVQLFSTISLKIYSRVLEGVST